MSGNSEQYSFPKLWKVPKWQEVASELLVDLTGFYIEYIIQPEQIYLGEKSSASSLGTLSISISGASYEHMLTTYLIRLILTDFWKDTLV